MRECQIKMTMVHGWNAMIACDLLKLSPVLICIEMIGFRHVPNTIYVVTVKCMCIRKSYPKMKTVSLWNIHVPITIVRLVLNTSFMITIVVWFLHHFRITRNRSHIFFFDYECTQNNGGKHEPNLVVAQFTCTRCLDLEDKIDRENVKKGKNRDTQII